MRADVFFSDVVTLPLVGISDFLHQNDTLVVVAPHPDDESLGCGGLIAGAVARGIEVHVIVVSDGVGSHPNSVVYPPARLLQLREKETRNAVAELGVAATKVHFLGLADTAVPSEGAAALQASETLRAIFDACGASMVCVTWPFDPHCDHQASAALVDMAVHDRPGIRVWHYPVWGWTLSSSSEVLGPPRGVRLDISADLLAKKKAIAAHQSQTTSLIDDDPDGFRLGSDVLRHFMRSFETFLSPQG